MSTRAAFQTFIDPAVAHLGRLAPLSDTEIAMLYAAKASYRRVSPHREIIAEGAPIDSASLILEGWACRVRFFADGRRQILSFLLPGDLIGICRQPRPLATTTVVALTDVGLCTAPRATVDTPGLREAYAVSGVLEESFLFRQIARLGRLSAYERIIDWMLEIRDRLASTGLAGPSSFPMPITQEALGDALGLTSVHVNRTLQAMRRDGLIDIRRGSTRLLDIDALRALVDERCQKISAPLRR